MYKFNYRFANSRFRPEAPKRFASGADAISIDLDWFRCGVCDGIAFGRALSQGFLRKFLLLKQNDCYLSWADLHYMGEPKGRRMGNSPDYAHRGTNSGDCILALVGRCDYSWDVRAEADRYIKLLVGSSGAASLPVSAEIERVANVRWNVEVW